MAQRQEGGTGGPGGGGRRRGRREEDEWEAKERTAKGAADLLRIRLERLQKNIETPAAIPEPQKEKGPPKPPEFVRNVVGSSAGAGSAEFHIYRNNRKRERARLEHMDKEAKEDELNEAYEKRRAERERQAADRTEKRRAKRRKKKQKPKKKGATTKDGIESGGDSGSESVEEVEHPDSPPPSCETQPTNPLAAS